MSTNHGHDPNIIWAITAKIIPRRRPTTGPPTIAPTITGMCMMVIAPVMFGTGIIDIPTKYITTIKAPNTPATVNCFMVIFIKSPFY